ncbi:hypothetical protein BGX27_004245, partial [Mortierella sp. AM989]
DAVIPEPSPEIGERPAIIPSEKTLAQVSLETKDAPFSLQEAANLDEHSATPLNRESIEEPMSQRSSARASRVPLEVVTDATASTTTAATYHQVPSPPLTPSTATMPEKEIDESTEEQATPVFLTPKSEAPLHNLGPHTEIAEQNTKSTKTQTPSATSPMPLSSTSSPQKEEQAAQAETDQKEKVLPEQFPNLLWSFCKTTAVVSAAVVVIGLGFGRRKPNEKA